MVLNVAFKAFDPAAEEFLSFKERFRAFATLHGLDDNPAKQRALLLATLEPQVFRRLESLVIPCKPAEKTIGTLFDVLQAHYQPARSVIVERYEFYRRVQKTCESVADYVSELRKMAARCVI